MALPVIFFSGFVYAVCFLIGRLAMKNYSSPGVIRSCYLSMCFSVCLVTTAMHLYIVVHMLSRDSVLLETTIVAAIAGVVLAGLDLWQEYLSTKFSFADETGIHERDEHGLVFTQAKRVPSIWIAVCLAYFTAWWLFLSYVLVRINIT